MNIRGGESAQVCNGTLPGQSVAFEADDFLLDP